MTEFNASSKQRVKTQVEKLRRTDWSNPWVQRSLDLGDLLADSPVGGDTTPVTARVHELLGVFADELQRDGIESVIQLIMAGAELGAMLTRLTDKFTPGQVNAAVREMAMRQNPDRQRTEGTRRT